MLYNYFPGNAAACKAFFNPDIVKQVMPEALSIEGILRHSSSIVPLNQLILICPSYNISEVRLYGYDLLLVVILLQNIVLISYP